MGQDMLAHGLVLASLLAPGSEPPASVHKVMAAALLLANGQNRYVPPTEVEVPTPSGKPEAQSLPAPAPSTAQGAAFPTSKAGEPLSGGLPAPIARSEVQGRFDQLAQAPPSNEEILRRLESLERENQKLRQQLQNQAAPSATPAAPGALRPGQAPPQMVSGWRISLYPWNADGYVTSSALSVFNMRNQRFNATLGQRPINPTSLVERNQGATNQMFVYRLEGWLHVTRPGRYEIGFEVTCGFDHPCNLLVKLGGVQLINERRKNFDNTLLMGGLDLEARDYPVELTFGIAKNRFVKFEPGAKVSLYPLIRPPGEYNFRDFQAGELLTEASPSVPYGVPSR